MSFFRPLLLLSLLLLGNNNGNNGVSPVGAKEGKDDRVVKRKRMSKAELEELRKLPLKERKERFKEILDEGTRRDKRAIRREVEHEGGRPMKRVTNRLKTRVRRFNRVRKKEGLASVLFPGVTPEEFYEGEEIPLWMDWVNSERSQVPFGYYDLPVCPGPTVAKAQKLRKNLGAKMQGHTIQPSPFQIHAKVNVGCTPLCAVSLHPKQILFLRKLVDRRYRIHAKIDSLPVLMGTDGDSTAEGYAVRGYAVGFKAPPALTGLKKEEYFLYNHVKFVIRYREDPDDFEGIRIVGFEARPVSIDHDIADGSIMFHDESAEDYEGDVRVGHVDSELATCREDAGVVNQRSSLLRLNFDQDPEAEVKKRGRRARDMSKLVVYSYEVEWLESDVHWGDRWDAYMIGSPDDKVHYLSILNSLTVVAIMSVIVSFVMVRTLRRDIKFYNEQLGGPGGDGMEEEAGWKLLHGDVFRKPTNQPKLLCVAVGVGMQLGTVVCMAILCNLVGFIKPVDDKGQTLTALIVLYALSSMVSGYWSSRLLKFIDDDNWKGNTVIVATAFPGLLVAMFVLLDLCLAIAGASSAVSFWTIVGLFLLWIGVSTPLVFVGSYLGYRQRKIDVPVKTKQIARAIPDGMQWYLKLPTSCILGGFLPFASAVLEIFFIMNALWLHQIYYVMGFLLIVVFIIGVTCAQVSIVFCYLQLSAEDHRWWWRSFLNSAGGGLYLGLYSVWFATSKLHLVGVLPAMLYLTYMSMISLCFALVCGSVGFLCTLLFVKTIYSAVKVE